MAERKDTDSRAPREFEARELEVRDNASFIPQAILPTPKPVDGWVFRWVRTAMQGSSDNANVSQRFREGWIPVKAAEHPELQLQTDFGSRFPENLEVGGLLLCKAPVEKVNARNKYYRDMADRQMESVDSNLMKENDPRMPLHAPQRSTRTTFHRP